MNNTIKELAFVVPTDVRFDSEVNQLSNHQLQRYHDMMHIFWNKLLEGFGEFGEFDWTFNKVIFKHSEITREMENRNIRHYFPINTLDDIKASSEEYMIAELSKIEEGNDIQKNDNFIEDNLNISFSPENIKNSN